VIISTAMDRINYLLVKEAKIIAMTCTHAALRRKDFVELSFKVLLPASPLHDHTRTIAV